MVYSKLQEFPELRTIISNLKVDLNSFLQKAVKACRFIMIGMTGYDYLRPS